MSQKVKELSANDLEIYKKLQQHLDEMPIGIPSVKSGSDMRILKHLFTPEEAKIALLLKFGWDRDLEPIENIYERAKDIDIDISIEKLEEILDRMAKKGSIMYKKEDDTKYYGNALLVVGMFEFQVNNLTKEFVEDFHKYYTEGWLPEAIKLKAAQLRTVPVEQSVNIDLNVSNYDDIEKLINSTEGPFAIINCICRQAKDLLDQPCKLTSRREVCLACGKMANSYIELGKGRSIGKEEVLEILRKNQEEGLVIQPDDSLKLTFICSCCGCCCENLTKIKSLPNPGDFTITNYYAEIDSEICTGCGTCVDICQMEAISSDDDKSIISKKRCIGCGNCTVICPNEAIKLHKKDREFTPYPTLDDLYDRIKYRKNLLKEKASKRKSK